MFRATVRLFGGRCVPAVLVILLGLCQTQMTAGAQSPTASVANQAPADVAHPGDIIRLRIWREPDLSGEFPIDMTGTVALPKIGQVAAGGKTEATIRSNVMSAYDRFLNQPSIEVTLLRRVQVLGAVKNPGLYPMDATMTVGDAIALAGGTTLEGNPDQIELVRSGKRISEKLTVSTHLSDSPIRSGDQIYVKERSWVSRNPGVLAGVLTSGAALFIAAVRR